MRLAYPYGHGDDAIGRNANHMKTAPTGDPNGNGATERPPHGSRYAPDSTPLVLLSGHMSSAATWEHQVRQLPRQRTVVVPDAHYGLNSIAAMARTIAARIPDRFDLVGWSMGGYIALELYPLVRERIRSLTLISTSARAESRDALIRRAEFLRAVQTSGLHAAFVASLDQMIKEPQRVDAGFRARIISNAVTLGEDVLFSQIKAMIGRNDNRSLLEQIDCDTLVVAATDDDVVPMDYTEEIARHIPRSRLHVVTGTGHCAPWERAAEINDVLANFWQETAYRQGVTMIGSASTPGYSTSD